MGFIDRLREDFENQERIGEEGRVRQAERNIQEALRLEGERQLAEQQVSEAATERHNQALIFHQHSGIGNSVEKLGLLLKEIQRERSRREGRDPHILVFDISPPDSYGGDREQVAHYLELAGSNEDPSETARYLKHKNSVVDFVFWDRTMRYVFNSCARSNEIRSCREFSERIVIVETYPDGMIRFHAGWFGSSRVPVVRWRDDLGILDHKFENAYRHPLYHTYRTNIEYGSDPGKPVPPGPGWIGVGGG